MTTTVTIGADDFTAAGLVPAADDRFEFTPAFLDHATVRLMSTQRWVVLLDVTGSATTQLPDASPGNAVFIWSSLSGWVGRIAVANYPAGTIALADLIRLYSVDPESLAPDATPPATWFQALGNYVPLSQKGQPLGVASLDSAGHVPPAQLPPGTAQYSYGTGPGEYHQATPLATWIFSHVIGRKPVVSVFSASGEEIEADVTADSSIVSVSFPAPATGSVVLS